MAEQDYLDVGLQAFRDEMERLTGEPNPANGQTRDRAPRREPTTPPAGAFANFRYAIVKDDSGKNSIVKVAVPINTLGDELLTLTRGWPKRRQSPIRRATQP